MTAKARKLKFKTHDRLKEPNASVLVLGARPPFLVIEVAVSEDEQPLAKDRHRWCQDSQGHVKLICLIKLLWEDGKANRFKVFMTLIKTQRFDTSTDQHPFRYRMESHTSHHREEVYPRFPSEEFHFSLKDVLPKKTTPAPSDSGPSITIPSQSFASKRRRYSML